MTQLEKIRGDANIFYLKGNVLKALDLYKKLISHKLYNKKVKLKEKTNDYSGIINMYRYINDNKNVLTYAKELFKINPKSFSTLTVLASAYLFNKDYENSIKYAKEAEIINSEDYGLNDIFAETYMLLENYEESKKAGIKSLQLKESKAMHYNTYALPKNEIKDFDKNKEKNIISFSLFGENPRYCETAVLNAVMCTKIYPSWTCRFYCDNTVPSSIIKRLEKCKAQIVMKENTNDIKDKLFWRFLVISDKSVDRYLIRDCDSLINTKESSAVEHWIESKKRFHIMRDFYTHTTLILAGMFGGTTDVFDDVSLMIQDYKKENHAVRTHLDQDFLDKMIWPTLKKDVLIHDSCFRYANTKEFPTYVKHDKNHHIGMNEGAASINVKLENAKDGDKIDWLIYNKDKIIICSYTSYTKNSTWSAELPSHYIKRIQNKEFFIQSKIIKD